MKVLHVIPSLSVKHGGPSFAMPWIARSLVEAGVQVDVATTDDDGRKSRLNVPLGRRIERDGYGLLYFRKQTEFYKVSLPLRRWLKERVGDYDAVHVHALFQFASVSAARAAWQGGVPYVIRPLGVLNRYGMSRRRPRLKSLSFRLIEKPILRRAAAMHYTSQQERVEACEAGATAPAAVIPLGIDLAPFEPLPTADHFVAKWPEIKNRKIILFLSRLDPKKGLDLLLESWAAIRKGDNRTPEAERWVLAVAGRGEEPFERALRGQVKRLGLDQDIIWLGFLDGKEKLSALAASRIFVLPSYSENFGIAVVEAMAAGLPCIITEDVAVSEEMRQREAGLVVKPLAQSLTEAMSRLLNEEPLRARLSTNARRLVKERFSMGEMGMALRKLYEEILTMRERERKNNPLSAVEKKSNPKRTGAAR